MFVMFKVWSIFPFDSAYIYGQHLMLNEVRTIFLVLVYLT